MSTQKAREALKRACEIWEDEKNYTAEDAGHNLWCNAVKAIRLFDAHEERVKALVEASDFYKQAVEATFEEDEEIQEIGVLDCCGDEDCAHCAYISAKERFAAALEAFKENSKK